MGIELKFYDTKLANAALTAPTDASGGEHNPSATISLNSVVQGDGESQRDGRRITMRSIYVEGTIIVAPQASLSTADSPATVFIALVLDTQCNGAILASEDVFTNKSGDAVLAAQPFRNLQFTKRFKILAIKRMTIANPNMTNDTGSTGGVISQGLRRPFKFFKKLSRTVTYSATTETIANTTDNSLNIIAYCSNDQLAPKLYYNARLRFIG